MINDAILMQFKTEIENALSFKSQNVVLTKTIKDFLLEHNLLKEEDFIQSDLKKYSF